MQLVCLGKRDIDRLVAQPDEIVSTHAQEPGKAGG
jgi:hypothetical protein